MIRTPLVAVAGLAVSALLLVYCGGSSPAQPQPPATPTPTPPPPTPPPPPYSVIPQCALPASGAGTVLDCDKPVSRMDKDINGAIDRVMAARPDLFNFNSVNGGPEILDVPKYMTAVAAAINEAGPCAHINPEGEMAVKTDNKTSEHWIVASRVGWAPPAQHWVQRKYLATCAPASF